MSDRSGDSERWQFGLSVHGRRYILLAIDLCLAWLASQFVLRWGGISLQNQVLVGLNTVDLLAGTATVGLSMWLAGVYRVVWRYAGVWETIRIVGALSGAYVVLFSIDRLILHSGVPAWFVLSSWSVTLVALAGLRLCLRLLQERRHTVDKWRRPALIVGAGAAGALVAKELLKPESKLRPIGFVDDDRFKQGATIHGLRVIGRTSDLPAIVREREISDIVIAIPSADAATLRDLVALGRSTKAAVRVIPRLGQLADGNVMIERVRTVSIEDLLGRAPVQLDLEQIAQTLRGERVLVTGAGGSIGSQLCREIARFEPSRLIMLGHGENSIFHIERELLPVLGADQLTAVVADIQDAEKLDQLFQQLRPTVVFHAAAHKHVPLMERQPEEAVKNNVLGTYNLAVVADRYHVKRFVMISTDKAVNPTSVMGATKRVAEMVCQAVTCSSQTAFIAVRFGNVLGSRGSVVPLFKEQIERGGPVTVTHPEMTRYFMTIPEAVQLVLQSAALGEGGEVFVLNMGEPVKIVDLARDLIRLSGYEPETEIRIEFTGIRPGEKLYEELLLSEEGTRSTSHERIMVERWDKPPERQRIEFNVRRLQQLAKQGDAVGIVQVLKELVPRYTPSAQWAALLETRLEAAATGNVIELQRRKTASGDEVKPNND